MMRIQRSVDDRLLVFVFAMMFAGCIAGQTGPKSAKPKKAATATTIEQSAYESFQSRDLVRAKKLRALKGTRFDGKRMDAIAAAGAEASEETWRSTASKLAEKLDKIPQDDQAAFDSVLEEIARAAERAGK